MKRRLIDFHTHPYRPQDLTPGTWDFIRNVSPAVAEHGDRLADPHFVADLLRGEGVERAVVLAEHCPGSSGNVRTDTVLDFCAREADFFLPFASVDINSDADPVGLMRNYLERGVRGLKLYPSYQFYYPNDARLYPIYELCQTAGIPVLIHIGSSVLPGTRIKYCDPIHLDDVTVDFPDLNLVMAHGGRGFWYDVCAFLAWHKPNLYIDVTGLVPGKLREHFPDLDRLATKMIFGTDWPAMPRSARYNADVIASLGLPQHALDALFFGNAARLLGIS